PPPLDGSYADGLTAIGGAGTASPGSAVATRRADVAQWSDLRGSCEDDSADIERPRSWLAAVGEARTARCVRGNRRASEARAKSRLTEPGMFSAPTKQRRRSSKSEVLQGEALSRIALRTWRALIGRPSPSCTLISSAATPLTIGAAQLVPLWVDVLSPGAAPIMFGPGATMPCF